MKKLYLVTMEYEGMQEAIFMIYYRWRWGKR